MILAGNDSSKQLKAQQDRNQSIISIPLVGQVAGIAAEAITGDNLRIAGQQESMVAAANEETSAKGWADFKYEQREQHAIAAAPGQWERAIATDTTENEDRKRLINERFKDAATVANQQRQSDLVQARVQANDFRPAGLKSNVPAGAVTGIGSAQGGFVLPDNIDQLREDKFNQLKNGIDAQYESQFGANGTQVVARDKAIADADADLKKAKAVTTEERAGYLVTLGGEDEASQHAAAADKLEAAHESLAALGERRAGERKPLETALTNIQNAAFQDPEVKKKEEAAAQSKLDSFDAGTVSQMQLLQERQEAENTVLVARAGADRLRITHQTFDAELKLLKAEGEAKVKLADEGSKATVAAANKADQDLAIARHGEHVIAEQITTDATIKSAGERTRRDFDAASLTDFDSRAKLEWNAGSAEDRPGIAARSKANRDALVAGQNFQHQITGEDNQSRVAAADDFMAGKMTLAQDGPRIRSLEREVELASPEDRSGVKAAATEELKAMKSELTGSHGGAIIHGTDFGDAGTAILSGRINGQKEKGARAAIDKGISDIAGLGGAGESTPSAGSDPSGTVRSRSGGKLRIVDPHPNHQRIVSEEDVAAQENKLTAALGEEMQIGDAKGIKAARDKLAAFRKAHHAAAMDGGTGKVVANPRPADAHSSGGNNQQMTAILTEVRKAVAALQDFITRSTHSQAVSRGL